MKECTSKDCNRKGIPLPLSEFSKDKSKKDGLQYKCKDCNKKTNNTFKINNPNHWVGWRKNSKEHLSQYEKNISMSEGYGVYFLINIPTQKYYIGEGQLYKRRSQHFSHLQRGVSKYGTLQSLWNQYPNIKDWEFKVIKKWDWENKEEGRLLETQLILEENNKNISKNINIRAWIPNKGFVYLRK